MYHYELIDGRYCLKDDDTGDVLYSMNEVAVCFSKTEYLPNKINYVLHKHGNPEIVHKWYVETKKKYFDHNLKDCADDLEYIQGKFPVEELNKVLSISGYMKPLLDNYYGLVRGRHSFGKSI